MSLLAAVLWLATGMPSRAWGEDPAPAAEPTEGTKILAFAATEADDFWLGVKCADLNEATRAQLKLDKEAQGIVVRHVIAKSPAAKAGIAVNDILLSVDDCILTSPVHLADAVRQAKGKELTLKLLRNGEKQEIKIQPVKRTAFFNLPANVRFIRPGHVVPPHVALQLAQHNLPDDTTITLTKHGSEPIKIVVKQCDRTYEATGAALETLPDEVRVHVEPFLGRVTVPLPPAAGDVLTYIPDPTQVRAQVQQVEETVRKAGEAAAAAVDEAHRQAVIARKRMPWLSRYGERSASAKLADQAEAAAKESGNWSDKPVDEKLDEIERRLEELRTMVQSVRESRAVKASEAATPEEVPAANP